MRSPSKPPSLISWIPPLRWRRKAGGEGWRLSGGREEARRATPEWFVSFVSQLTNPVRRREEHPLERAPIQPLSGHDRALPAVVRSTMDEASAGLEASIARRLRVSRVGMTPLRAVWVKHRSKRMMAISERVRQIPSPLP